MSSARAEDRHAAGMVSFVSLKRQKTLAVELMRTSGGWRIFDIAGAGGSGSLRALYKVK